ncbi:AraC family transcriptional regulator [Segetibacter sp.]|uniref:helix-turn-helix domain-containing protein n=1 Tax=Segetibacter sp. TaxID=2231182 RepID=UPI00263883ED|nr:AraC family transcriptional regulator [Segetibacter sp.]MCW3082627.1 AraC family transcriptional regulator [Segetibacter sp.]
MVKIEFDHTDYAELLGYYAEVFKGKVKNNKLELPPDIGSGFIKLIELPNGLQGLVSDYTVNQDLLLTRSKINKDYFTLRFDEVIIPDAVPIDTGEASLMEISPVRSAVFLGSTKFDWMFLSTKGTRVKGVNILFSKDWLEQFLEVESVGDLIKKYLSLKMSAFNYEPMDMEYKRILAEIVETNVDPSFETLIIQNRVMLLLERFFTRIYYKMSDMHFDVKLSNEDINRLKMIEKELVKDFSVEPPGITKLARLAAMSPSKLKNSFKEIFGLPVYQYFQKHRMNKAKAMLLSRKYSVREVGIELGYSNLSNFAKAFKKSFDQLPSDLLDR